MFLPLLGTDARRDELDFTLASLVNKKGQKFFELVFINIFKNNPFVVFHMLMNNKMLNLKLKKILKLKMKYPEPCFIFVKLLACFQGKQSALEGFGALGTQLASPL